MLNQRLLKDAMAAHQRGDFTTAQAIYEKLQKSSPRDAHLLHFRALLATHRGDTKESIALLEKAIRINANVPEFYEAPVQNYAALKNKPKLAETYNLLGNALRKRNRNQEAIAAYDKSLEVQPGNAGVLSNRISTLGGLGNSDEIRKGHRAIIGRLRGKAKTHPDLMALGNAHEALGESEKALAAFQKAIALNPKNADAHFNASSILLRNGDYAQGWKAWEHRWTPGSGYVELSRCGFSQPMWKGQSAQELNGPLLIVGEMGFGDILHFARYVPLLADRGYDVLFEVQPGLQSLFEYSFDHPRIRIIPRKYYRWDKGRLGWLARLTGQRLQQANVDEIYRDLPFVAWAGLMSLPIYFGTTLETIPSATPYLKVPPAKQKHWKKIIDRLPGAVKVGLVWAGNPEHPADSMRSLKLGQLAPLFDLKQISFISLQKDRRGEDLPKQENIVDIASGLKDFSDTAAAIEALDLVLTVDTSVAHLAGALGKPTWIMIPRIKDWRWGLKVDTTGWYPTARLFRQPVQGEWQGVIAAVGQALAELR